MPFVPLTINKVKEKIYAKFAKLGYTAWNSSQRIHVSAGNNRVDFGIEAANIKRFEVYVTGDNEGDFNREVDLQGTTISTDPYNSGGDWRVTARFRREERGVELFFEWLARVKKSHAHLLEILHPSALADPHNFRDGNFVTDDGWIRGGSIISARIDSIVAIDGVKIVEANRPGVTAWVLAEVRTLNNIAHICTDGNSWYPVIELSQSENGKKVYRMFEQHSEIGNLNMMNHRDQQLINEALRRYVAELSKAKEEA